MGPDARIEIALNTLANRDGLLRWLTPQLASHAVYLIPVILLALWYLDPGVDDAGRRAAAGTVPAAALALLANAGLAAAVPYRPRPFVALPLDVHPLVTHPPDSSFPSDHAAVTFAVAVCLLRATPRRYRWLLLLALLICAGRVAAGLHWPSDILAGAAIGIASALAVRALPAVTAAAYRVACRLLPRRTGPAQPSR